MHSLDASSLDASSLQIVWMRAKCDNRMQILQM